MDETTAFTFADDEVAQRFWKLDPDAEKAVKKTLKISQINEREYAAIYIPGGVSVVSLDVAMKRYTETGLGIIPLGPLDWPADRHWFIRKLVHAD